MLEPEVICYCPPCTAAPLSSWQGWPHKKAVPLLPTLTERCASCGQADGLASDTIAWTTHHPAGATGLPDHWSLELDADPSHWGRPYYAEGSCPKCGDRTVVSEMCYPNGTRELMHNCPRCGVRAAQDRCGEGHGETQS